MTLRVEQGHTRDGKQDREERWRDSCITRVTLRKHEDNLSTTMQTNGVERLLELLAHAQQSFTSELEQRRIFEVGPRRSAHLICMC
jgi:hypothetical protein